MKKINMAILWDILGTIEFILGWINKDPEGPTRGLICFVLARLHQNKDE